MQSLSENEQASEITVKNRLLRSINDKHQTKSSASPDSIAGAQGRRKKASIGQSQHLGLMRNMPPGLSYGPKQKTSWSDLKTINIKHDEERDLKALIGIPPVKI